MDCNLGLAQTQLHQAIGKSYENPKQIYDIEFLIGHLDRIKTVAFFWKEYTKVPSSKERANYSKKPSIG
jgi:hypothetical protein